MPFVPLLRPVRVSALSIPRDLRGRADPDNDGAPVSSAVLGWLDLLAEEGYQDASPKCRPGSFAPLTVSVWRHKRIATSNYSASSYADLRGVNVPEWCTAQSSEEQVTCSAVRFEVHVSPCHTVDYCACSSVLNVKITALVTVQFGR
jgi:hypothetical protein